MSEYSKYNIVYRLQKWMDIVQGQTFLNYAYSWGASVVILGALFKLTHLPGANVMLFLGMGTEVCVFFISAFDRPFDKTAEGRDIPTKVTREYLESGRVSYSKDEEAAALREGGMPEAEVEQNATSVTFEPQNNDNDSSQTEWHEPVTETPAATGNLYSGNGGSGNGQTANEPVTAFGGPSESASSETSVNGNAAQPAYSQPQPSFVPQMSAEQAEALNEAQGNYVEELKKLVSTLEKVNEQSSRLTRDSEEMENLNRTLTGISKVYEMQLKGASKQIGTIDEINEQTRKMAEQIEQLNSIYARMIQAMTVNMRAAAPGGAVTPNTEG